MFTVRSIFAKRRATDATDALPRHATPADPATEQATADYCRTARRLRHRLAHAPVRLHRSLRALPPIVSVEPIAPATPHDRFAAAVIASLEGTTLRYSRRIVLLKQAATLGIERFEANLVIATVQHQAMKRLNVISPVAADFADQNVRRVRSVVHTNAAPHARWASVRSFAPWLLFVAIQGGIVLAAVACWRAWQA